MFKKLNGTKIPNSENNIPGKGSAVGQGSALQDWSSFSGPVQGWPPLLAGVDIVRVRDCVPSPQVVEHSPHDDHGDHSQLTK